MFVSFGFGGVWGFLRSTHPVGMLTGSCHPPRLYWVLRGCRRTEENKSCPRDLSSTYTVSRMRTSQFLVLVGKDS